MSNATSRLSPPAVMKTLMIRALSCEQCLKHDPTSIFSKASYCTAPRPCAWLWVADTVVSQHSRRHTGFCKEKYLLWSVFCFVSFCQCPQTLMQPLEVFQLYLYCLQAKVSLLLSAGCMVFCHRLSQRVCLCLTLPLPCPFRLKGSSS